MRCVTSRCVALDGCYSAGQQSAALDEPRARARDLGEDLRVLLAREARVPVAVLEQPPERRAVRLVGARGRRRAERRRRARQRAEELLGRFLLSRGPRMPEKQTVI